jgi:hypothetical protein
MAVRTFCCIPLLGSSSSFQVSRSMPSCRKSLSELHEYDPAQTSPSAASSPILRAALSRSLAEGWMAMSILRQLYEPSNSSSRIPQPIRGRFRGQPDHVVLGLSLRSARQQIRVMPTGMKYRVAKHCRNSRARREIARSATLGYEVIVSPWSRVRSSTHRRPCGPRLS